MTRAILLASILAAWLAAPASAQDVASVTTRINLKACSHKAGKADEDYGEWRCAGYAGMRILISAGDQRSYVSFGTKARKELAAKQTLASFNGEGKAIEWRGDRGAGGKIKPYAAIQRWSTTVTGDDDKITRGMMLVVTRLPPGAVCHVGYVDAVANPHPFELAQKIADETARNFKCGSDKAIVLGNKGPGFSGSYGD